MTALGTTTCEHETAALGAGANEETVRADTLDLGGLIGTLGSHDCFLCLEGEACGERALIPAAMKNPEKRRIRPL